MTDLIDELRKAHEAATAGKWQIMGEDTSSYIEILSPRTCVSITSKYLTVRNPNAGNDARFQALAHNSMPLVLALFEASEALSDLIDQSQSVNSNKERWPGGWTQYNAALLVASHGVGKAVHDLKGGTS